MQTCGAQCLLGQVVEEAAAVVKEQTSCGARHNKPRPLLPPSK